jgi:hypothetical protein
MAVRGAEAEVAGRTFARIALLIAALAVSGCKPKGADLLQRHGARFTAIRESLKRAGAELPAPYSTEITGGPLGPAAVVADVGDNTQFVDLWQLVPGGALCANPYFPGELADWLSLTEPGSLRAGVIAKQDAAALQPAVDRALGARYVVLYRMLDCEDPDTAKGNATVEAFVLDLDGAKLQRSVRIHAERKGADILGTEVHDRLLGALAGRAGTDVRVSGLKAPHAPIVPLTQSDEDAVARHRSGHAQAHKADGFPADAKCTVDTEMGDVSGAEGAIPCAEAKALVEKLRAKGISARVVLAR